MIHTMRLTEGTLWIPAAPEAVSIPNPILVHLRRHKLQRQIYAGG